MNREDQRVGKAYLIGAGPGDPRLITLRGVEAIAASDMLLVDDLVSPELLRHAKESARIVRVGKRCGRPSTAQEVITRLLVSSVRRGAIVGRLKGGDPFVFGRGGEEALALARAGLPFEIVPGVSAALGAAASAGIPLTHREVASSVAFMTGRRKDGTLPAVADADTIVVYMCQRTIGRVARDLLARGRPATTPAAIVCAATTPAQQVHVGTLGDLAALADGLDDALFDPALPTLAIVGEVAAYAHELAQNGASPALLAALGDASGF
jgi:uroporphyrin-III C-methyltransferase